MTTTLRIFAVWVVSAIAFISFERLMAKNSGKGVWNHKDPSKSLNFSHPPSVIMLSRHSLNLNYNKH